MAGLIKTLSAALSEAIEALDGRYPDLDDRLCCNGRDCACQGSTRRELLLHNLKTTLREVEQITELEAINHD